MTPIGVIADDYTGASDIANTLAKGGLATVQLLGVPREPLPVSAEALVVALKSRSIPAAEAVEQSLAALDWLRSVGCGQIVFKVCSTFDSTPAGNIGPIGAVVNDCEAAAVWTLQHARCEFGSERVVVKASSAGAHVAVLALLRLRDRHKAFDRIVGAALYFGLYDFSGTPMVRRAGPETLVLHGPTVRSTLCKLTPGMSDDERRDPSLSPLYADLRSLPPALFIVGAEDMLLEDNERMEARWRAASGNAALLVAPNTRTPSTGSGPPSQGKSTPLSRNGSSDD